MLVHANSRSPEVEKKAVAALLGKLYISPYSTEEKTRELFAEVSEAVEQNLISDTTGRNALYKIHVSLGKIVNALDQAKEAGMRRGSRSSMSRSESLVPEEHAVNREERAATVGTEPQIKEEEEGEDGVSVAESVANAQEEDDDSGAEGTVIHTNTDNDAMKVEVNDGDSLVSDLLDDDGDTVMGD